MKKIIYFLGTIILFSLATQTVAGTLGDINSDGKIDLREAIYALQVVTGIQTQTSTTGSSNYKFGTTSEFSRFTSSSWTEVPNLSAEIITHGEPILLLMNLVAETDDFTGSTWHVGFSIDGVLMENEACRGYYDTGEQGSDLTININCIDVPPAGTYNYGVMIKVDYGGSDGIKINQDGRESISSITAIELK